MKLRAIPFHVLFLSAFPALAMLVSNLGQTAVWVVRRPLIVSIAGGLIGYLLPLAVLKHPRGAGLWTSLGLVLFFSYGHVYDLVEDIQVFGFLVGRHRYLVLLWIGLFSAGSWWVIKKSTGNGEITAALNGISLALVLLQLGQIGVYQVRRDIAYKEAQASISETFLSPADLGELPDIYLIILDMYGREDALAEIYHYDNHAFIEQLEALGFYVAACARSNYSHTVLSLSSQLNMDYVDDLLEDVNYETGSYLLKHSTVKQSLEEIGYTSYAFDTGAGWANMDTADVFIDRPPTGQITWIEAPFEIMFMEGTLARLYVDSYIERSDEGFKFIDSPVEMKAVRTRLILDHLRRLPGVAGPKFVLAHIMVPHPPHVFFADGTVNPGAESVDGIAGLAMQLDYLNPVILDIVRNIIANSDPDPIVIIEGDHGFEDLQRTSILSAVYLPEGADGVLYPRLSSVNLFRLIFNEYFGTELPLLEDRSYMHAEGDWFTYTLQQEWNPACEP